jgi:transcriptional regulator with XRE-family HTH domain
MDSTRVARLFVAVRREKHWRQVDLAKAAKVSQATVSRAERAQHASITLGALERIALALGVDLRLEARWCGGLGDRLVDRRHAALVELVVAMLRSHGWEVVVEYTFNQFGERGSVDVLAFHAASRALLIVEVKTRLADLQAFLASFGRKVRILPRLLRADQGWDPLAIGRLVVVEGSTSNRATVERHRTIFDTAFPGRAAKARAWIRAPSEPMGAIWFVSPDVMARTSDGKPAPPSPLG